MARIMSSYYKISRCLKQNGMFMDRFDVVPSSIVVLSLDLCLDTT